MAFTFDFRKRGKTKTNKQKLWIRAKCNLHCPCSVVFEKFLLRILNLIYIFMVLDLPGYWGWGRRTEKINWGKSLLIQWMAKCSLNSYMCQAERKTAEGMIFNVQDALHLSEKINKTALERATHIPMHNYTQPGLIYI